MHRHMFCFKRRDAITRKGMVIMKKINRRNFLKVMGLASASLTLAACGGSSSTATSTAASTATSTAASAAAGDARCRRFRSRCFVQRHQHPLR